MQPRDFTDTLQLNEIVETQRIMFRFNTIDGVTAIADESAAFQATYSLLLEVLGPRNDTSYSREVCRAWQRQLRKCFGSSLEFLDVADVAANREAVRALKTPPSYGLLGSEVSLHTTAAWHEHLPPDATSFAPIPRWFRVRTLMVAVAVGLDGPRSVVESWTRAWSSRHDSGVRSSAANTTSRSRPSAPEKVFELIRFALGFFGARKVDARNNP